MTPLAEFVSLLVKTAEEKCDLDSAISLRELPKEGGIYAEMGEGFTEETFYNKSTVKRIPVLFLCRNADQERCLSQLESICNYFERLKSYPEGSCMKWLTTEVAKARPASAGMRTECITIEKAYQVERSAGQCTDRLNHRRDTYTDRQAIQLSIKAGRASCLPPQL